MSKKMGSLNMGNEKARELSTKLDSVLTPAEVKKKMKDAQARETATDYKETREIYKRLLKDSEESIQSLMALAQDSEHPRAFEVLGQMIKHTSDIADKMIDLQAKMRKLEEMDNELENPIKRKHQGNGMQELPAPVTTNNNIFVGSTTELQKMIIAQQKQMQEDIVINDDTND